MLILMSDGSVVWIRSSLAMHAIDDVDGVGARLLADRHRDGVLAVEPRLAADFLVASVTRPTSPNVMTEPSCVGEHDPVEVLDVRAAGPSCAARPRTARR